MKFLLFPVILLFTVFDTSAQNQAPPASKPLCQELGIFGQTEATGNNNNQHMGLVGLQYKRWRNEHLGFRVIGAFAQYTATGSEVLYISGDTAVSKQEHFNISLPVLGVGIEA